MGNIFDKIFEKLGEKDQENIVTSRDIKIALKGAEREIKRNKMGIKKINQKDQQLLQKLKKARREGRTDDVNEFYQDLQDNKIEKMTFKKEGKILRLETMALKNTLRGVERLEKTSNRGRIRDLMSRIKDSNINEKLQAGTIDEESYLDSLGMIMDDITDELQDFEGSLVGQNNPEKARFLADLDEIIAAEEEGSEEIALEKEEKLRSNLESEEPASPEF